MSIDTDTLTAIINALSDRPTTPKPDNQTGWEGRNVIVRSADSGVHWGTLLHRHEDTVTLGPARRLHYWDGAFTLSAVAVDGVSKPRNCRFSRTVDEIMVLGVCEIIPTTAAADANLAAVPVHNPS